MLPVAFSELLSFPFAPSFFLFFFFFFCLLFLFSFHSEHSPIHTSAHAQTFRNFYLIGPSNIMQEKHRETSAVQLRSELSQLPCWYLPRKNTAKPNMKLSHNICRRAASENWLLFQRPNKNWYLSHPCHLFWQVAYSSQIPSTEQLLEDLLRPYELPEEEQCEGYRYEVTMRKKFVSWAKENNIKLVDYLGYVVVWWPEEETLQKCRRCAILFTPLAALNRCLFL